MNEPSPTTIEIDHNPVLKNFRLKKLLHFIWSYRDNSLKPFELVNGDMAKEIMESDPLEILCHCEVITNNTIRVWQKNEWETEYTNVMSRKFNDEVKRRYDIRKDSRIKSIAYAIAGAMNLGTNISPIMPIAIAFAVISNEELKKSLETMKISIDFDKLEIIPVLQDIENEVKLEMEKAMIPTPIKNK